MTMNRTKLSCLGGAALAALALLPGALRAADHGDAPTASNDQAADIADVFAFVDPNDFGRVVVAMTQRGFIVPSEAVNFGIFDPNVTYRINLETTGDTIPDGSVTVTFSPRTSSAVAQTATVTVRYNDTATPITFTAPCTNSSTADTAPTPVVTEDLASGIRFFGGMVDDPFFFDIVGFNRFVASVLAGSPNPSQLNRGRDSFAGYNCMGFAVSLNKRRLRAANATLGVYGETLRYPQQVNADGVVVADTTGQLRRVDRMGNPAVNVALIPFARKNEYNAATPTDDANGRFANDIVATLTALQTNPENIDILADVAVTNGDMLRLSLGVPNTGPGGGNNPEAGFPNGRRFGDDTIDTILFFVTNQSTKPRFSDNANSNDVLRSDVFPYFGLAQQPRMNGVVDDNTRN